jgi:hypothetical protein
MGWSFSMHIVNEYRVLFERILDRKLLGNTAYARHDTLNAFIEIL